MECNCEQDRCCTAKIRHVYGNVLKIAVPLTLRTITVEEGVLTSTDSEFFPSTNYPTSIVFDDGLKQPKFVVRVDGSTAYLEDLGTIPVGTYSLTVTCKDDEGNPYRFKQRYVLQVVDASKDAGIADSIEYESQEWLLDGAIFLQMKGDKGDTGVGILNIDTQETDDHGGYNTVTITLTNGESQSFQVRNGWGGTSGIIVNNTLYTQNADGYINIGNVIRQHQSLANYVSESELNTRMLEYYRRNEVDALLNEKADADDILDVARLDEIGELRKQDVHRVVLEVMNIDDENGVALPAQPSHYFQNGHIWHDDYVNVTDLGTPSPNVIYCHKYLGKQYIWINERARIGGRWYENEWMCISSQANVDEYNEQLQL